MKLGPSTDTHCHLYIHRSSFSTSIFANCVVATAIRSPGSFRPSLVALNGGVNVVENLSIGQLCICSWPLIDGRIVQSANLDHHKIRKRRNPREDMGSAPPAKFALCRQVHAWPFKRSRRPFCVLQPGGTQADNHIWMATGDILTVPAIALGLELRFGRRAITQIAAKAAASNLLAHPAGLLVRFQSV